MTKNIDSDRDSILYLPSHTKQNAWSPNSELMISNLQINFKNFITALFAKDNLNFSWNPIEFNYSRLMPGLAVYVRLISYCFSENFWFINASIECCEETSE